MLKMKIFQSIRPYFVDLGLQSSQPRRNNWNSAKSWISFFLMCLTVGSIVIFFFWEATIFEEYATAFNSFQALNIVAFEFIIFEWKSRNFYKYMVKFENIIEKSECNRITVNEKLN